MLKSELLKIAIEADRNTKRVKAINNKITYNNITIDAHTSTLSKIVENVKRYFDLDEFTYYIEKR